MRHNKNMESLGLPKLKRRCQRLRRMTMKKYDKQLVFYSPTHDELVLMLFDTDNWKVTVCNSLGTKYTTPFVYHFYIPDDAIIIDKTPEDLNYVKNIY